MNRHEVRVMTMRRSAKAAPPALDMFWACCEARAPLYAIGALCKEYGQHFKMKPNEIPIIRLDVKSYQHSNRSCGRISAIPRGYRLGRQGGIRPRRR
jgi:hypothetical protein